MFIHAVLDLCPGFGWQGGPSFNTRIVTTQAWIERRNVNNIECRHSYTLPLQNITDDAYMTQIKQVFLACRGSLHSFKVKDYSDFEAENEVFFEGDGTTTVFQLAKVSTFGVASYTRIIRKPVPNVAVTVDSVSASPVIDYTQGTVTFAVAPAIGAIGRWTGEFWVPSRFANDALVTTIDNKTRSGDFLINGSVDLIEVFDE